MSSKKGLDYLKQLSKYILSANGFDTVIQKMKFTEGGSGRCVAEFKVEPEHCNRAGGLHGGLTATIVDDFTTYALLTNDKDSPPGVTVDLHVSYLKGAREGDEVIIEANTIKCGKTLAYLECELRHKKDGSIIARGSQTKYVGGSS